MSLAWWSGYFRLAALFNVAVALPMLVMPQLAAILLGDVSFNHPPLTQLLAWLILSFGIGYWLVGRDPVGNRAIALLGTIGKLGVVAIAWIGFGQGTTPLVLALLTLADLVWAIGFLRFYAGSARRAGG